jgi:hypothetical protein
VLVLDPAWVLGTPLWAARAPYGGGGGARTPSQGSGLHTWRSRTNLGGPDCIPGGRGPTLGVRTIYPGVRRSPVRVWTTVDALEYTTFSGHVVAPDPPTWWSRALLWT